MSRSVLADGNRVRWFRQQSGMTQLELAKQIGCSKRTVERIESGKPAFRSTLRSIAETLQVSIDALMPKSDDEQVSPADWQRVDRATTGWAESAFVAPVLHLVIAEDNPAWMAKLESYFRQVIENWALYKTGQFQFSITVCRSVEEFCETCDLLLDRKGEREFVFATLDAVMPMRREDDVAVARAGQRLLQWCFDHQQQKLEFCIISGDQRELQQLYSGRFGLQLQSRSIKRVYKGDIGESFEDFRLAFEPDLRALIRSKIRYCRWSSRSADQMIWFGNSALLRYLELADLVAETGGGTYILFADDEGYADDWFRFCCFLRSVSPTLADLHDSSSGDLSVEMFKHCHDAMLVSRIDRVPPTSFDLRDALEVNDYLRRVEEEEKLLFIKVPRIRQGLAIQLDPDHGLPLLRYCLDHIYGADRAPTDDTLESATHRKLIRFPSSESLRELGIYRTTIEYESSQANKSIEKLRGENTRVRIDPEVEMVAEMVPWRTNGGLHALRESIRGAFESFMNHGAAGSIVGIESFDHDSDPVYQNFYDALGFLLRGQRIYEQLLTQHGQLQSQADTGPMIVRSLQSVLRIYASLARFFRQEQELRRKHNDVPSNAEFDESHLQTLRDVFLFLDGLFINPVDLEQAINTFRQYASGSGWRSFFAELTDTSGWEKLVSGGLPSWPFQHLPLHSGLAQVLRLGGIGCSFYWDGRNQVRGLPNLEQEWMKTEERRSDIVAEIILRQSEQAAAIRFMSRCKSQPICSHLRESAPRVQFARLVQSFVVYNTNLAICEDRSRSKRSLMEQDVSVALGRSDLGAKIRLLTAYVEAIQLHSQHEFTYFAKWAADLTEYSQTDVIRLLREIAKYLLSQDAKAFWRQLSAENAPERQWLEGFAQSIARGACPPLLVLRFLALIRNCFDRTDPDFWDQIYYQLIDVFRRFVCATTMDNCRLAATTSDDSFVLWNNDDFATHERPDIKEPWTTGLLLSSDEEGFRQLFQIEDLIRVDPIRNEVLGILDGKRWISLTLREDDQRPQGGS